MYHSILTAKKKRKRKKRTELSGDRREALETKNTNFSHVDLQLNIDFSAFTVSPWITYLTSETWFSHL